MIEISYMKDIEDINNRKQLIQTIILKKNIENSQTIHNTSSFLNEKNESIPDMPFKISKFSYYNVKKKCKTNFSQGKIYVKLTRDRNNYINLTFYDTSLRLRFQGLINVKKSTLNIDIIYKNCVKINEIIGLIYFMDETGNSKYDMTVTNIDIYFLTKTDINKFFNCLS